MVVVFATTLAAITTNTVVIAALPDITDHFGLSGALSGLPVASAALPGVFLALVVGLLADRFGRRPVLVTCLLLFGGFGMAAAAAPSFWVLLLLRVGQGAGASGLVNLAIVLIGDHWSGRERARRISWNAAVLTLGIAILPVIGGWLAEAGSWRTPFLLCGFGIGVAILARLVLPAPHQRQPIPLRTQLREARPYVTDPTVVTAVSLGAVLFTLVFGLTLGTLPEHLEQEFGIGAGGRGLVLLANAVLSIVVILALPRIHRRLGRNTTIVVGTVAYAVGALCVATATRVPLVVVAAGFAGLAEGLVIPTLQDYVAGTPPAQSRGIVVALFTTGTRLGQTIGPLLAAATIAATSTRAAFVIGTVASLGLVSLALSRRASLPA